MINWTKPILFKDIKTPSYILHRIIYEDNKVKLEKYILDINDQSKTNYDNVIKGWLEDNKLHIGKGSDGKGNVVDGYIMSTIIF